MDNADTSFDDITISLNLLKLRFVCLSQEVDTRMEEPLCPAVDRKMYILPDDHEPSNSISTYRRSSVTYYTPRSGPLSIPNTKFLAISPSSIGVKDISPISPTVSDSLAQNLNSSTTPLQQSGPYCPCFIVQEAILTPFSRIVKY